MSKVCPRPGCGNTIAADEDRFCYRCGAEMIEKEKCVECGRELVSQDRFCPRCGKKVERS